LGSNIEANQAWTERREVGAIAIILPGDRRHLTGWPGCGSGRLGDENGGVNRRSNDSEDENEERREHFCFNLTREWAGKRAWARLKRRL